MRNIEPLSNPSGGASGITTAITTGDFRPVKKPMAILMIFPRWKPAVRLPGWPWTVDLLRMTGNSLAADELELSTYNVILGAQNPTGRWWTYNTPMDGYRKASDYDIDFQARPGSPELNCCSVNGPRALGILSDWAVMTGGDEVVINYFGASRTNFTLPCGAKGTILQETKYPG